MQRALNPPHGSLNCIFFASFMEQSSWVVGFLFLLSLTANLADDSYIFAYLRWPGGLCYKGTCCFPSTWTEKNDFLVNYIANSSTTATCTETTFNITEIESVLPEMYEYWPSISCPNTTEESFWEQIWDDNGICTRFTELEYFSTGLSIRDEADIITILSDNGIVPSATTTYNLTDIVDAIDDGLGATNTTVLYCGSTSNHVIRNLRLCVNGTGSGFITCPTYRSSKCNETVYLLPLNDTDVSLPGYPLDMLASE